MKSQSLLKMNMICHIEIEGAANRNAGRRPPLLGSNQKPSSNIFDEAGRAAAMIKAAIRMISGRSSSGIRKQACHSVERRDGMAGRRGMPPSTMLLFSRSSGHFQYEGLRSLGMDERLKCSYRFVSIPAAREHCARCFWSITITAIVLVLQLPNAEVSSLYTGEANNYTPEEKECPAQCTALN
jgi:hypothetical protein